MILKHTTLWKTDSQEEEGQVEAGEQVGGELRRTPEMTHSYLTERTPSTKRALTPGHQVSGFLSLFS